MFKNRPQSKEKRRRLASNTSSDEIDPMPLGDGGSLLFPRRQKGIVTGPTSLRPSESTVTVQEGEPLTKIVSGIDAFRMSGVEADITEDAKMHHQRDPDELEEKIQGHVKNSYGPNRASVRTTSRFDYQMDICKDFKDSGYCGFGDSCKFLHDRSVVKTGWELDREWNEKSKIVPAITPLKPTLCFECQRSDELCKTTCGHVFCEPCFLKTSSSKCKECGTKTAGIFNAL